MARRKSVGVRSSPFLPGPGLYPPFLAGRETEQALIAEFLDALENDATPRGGIILYGPRGNGKTALLLWSRREAEARGINAVRFSGAQAPSLEALASLISEAPRWLRHLRGISLPWGGVTMKEPSQHHVESILARRARKRPTLLAVDEAHRLGVEAGAVLMNVVQQLQGDGLPLMLLLAGTPDLPRHLSSMGASFWLRNERMPIGALEPGPAADALRIPLEKHGRSIEDSTLQQVVAASHGYPFFVQVWGHLLWKVCEDPSQSIAHDDMDRARPRFEQTRERLYDELLTELEAVGLVSVAAGVAEEFADSERVFVERVELAIRSVLERRGESCDREAVRDSVRVLQDLGYIWRVVEHGTVWYEPGVPSFMQFVTRFERGKLEARGETL